MKSFRDEDAEFFFDKANPGRVIGHKLNDSDNPWIESRDMPFWRLEQVSKALGLTVGELVEAMK